MARQSNKTSKFSVKYTFLGPSFLFSYLMLIIDAFHRMEGVVQLHFHVQQQIERIHLVNQDG